MPESVIVEDPVTGSAHCALYPYWKRRLRKDKLTAKQLSKRGGVLTCEEEGDKVMLSGKAILFLEGNIYIN